MPIFYRDDKQRPLNRNWIYLLILVAIAGFYISKCAKSNNEKFFRISNAQLSEESSASVDVTFQVQSLVDIDMEKNVEISVFSNKGEFLVGNKITRIKIPAMQKKRYRKVVEILRQIHQDEDIDSVRVDFYDKIQ